MSLDFLYSQVPRDHALEKLASDFCDSNGDHEDGTISEDEYDLLFDHLGAVVSKYASYSDSVADADFRGYRYVDQVPWICLVPSDDANPAIALKVGLEAIQSAHRPFVVSFDYYPDYLMVMPPNLVYSTFELTRLQIPG